LWIYPHGESNARRYAQLSALVEPSNAANTGVTWLSSNVSIASVVNGHVTTNGTPGLVTITVTTLDGSHTSSVDIRVHGQPTESGSPSSHAGNLIILHAAAVASGTGNNAHRTFVELHNRSAAAIDLDGLSLQWAGGQGTTWDVIPLSGNIPAGHSFLILGDVGDAAARLQISDGDANLLQAGFQLNNRAFRLALMDGTAPLTVHNPADMSHTGSDLRADMPASGTSSSAAVGQTAAGFIDLLGVVNTRAGANDVIHGAKGHPAYRISNQTSIRRTSLDAPANNFNDFTGLRWGPPTAAEPLAVADEQMDVLRPRNLAYGAAARTFPAMSWAFEPPPPPPPPPAEAIAAWNYTAANFPASPQTLPATSGSTVAGTSLVFYYADGVQATLRNGLRIINAPGEALNGWFPLPAGTGATVQNSAAWIITLDTTGYEDIIFSADQASSGNGPGEFGLAWRVGTTDDWALIPGAVVTTADLPQGDAFFRTFDNIALPSEVGDQAVVQIRVWISSEMNRSGAALTPGQGNTSINNIVFTGTSTSTVTPPIAAWNLPNHSPTRPDNFWPATSGTHMAETNLQFFYAAGTQATLGRDANDRAAVNVPNIGGNTVANGWFRTPDGVGNTSTPSESITVQNAAGWVITLSTLGYENITFSAYQSSSNHGPRDFRLAYRIGDSGSWTVFEGEGTVTVQGDGAGNPLLQPGETFADVPLPTTVNNQAEVQVKVWIAANGSRSGGLLEANNGNTSINNIVFAGAAID